MRIRRSHKLALMLPATLLALSVSLNGLCHSQEKKSQPNGGQQQPTPPKNPMETLPKVVAVVNGQTISRDQLGDACLRRYGSVVLDNLLNKHLILQACAAKGIQVTQADVNDEITRVSQKFSLTTTLFLQALEEERDITPEQYASEIVWPMLALRALAADKIQVSNEEIDRVIQSEYGPKVQVRMIAVAQAEKAQQLYAQATAAPETFRRLAKEQSDDAVSASVEGLLPPIRHNSSDDQLERVAFQLRPNEISPVFQIGEMHVFLQCVRHFEATPPNAQFLPAIQQRIHDQLRDQRLGAAADEIFATLQKNSKVVPVIGNPELENKHPGVAGFINGQPVARDHLASQCIARHGRPILRGEIDRLLLTAELKAANKTVIQPDIDAEIARAADLAGYLNADGTPNSQAWLTAIMEEEGATLDLYIDDAVWPSVALKKLVEDDVTITEDDLQKGFESNFGPRAEVLAIVLSNQRTAQDVFREARGHSTEDGFGQLAAKYSVEPVSRSNFGKIPPLRKHGGRPALEEVAFALHPGEISGVVAWGEQYAILYKQGETTPLVQDFQAVRGEIYKEIMEKKLRLAMHARLTALHGSAQIDNFLEGTAQAGNVKTASATAPAAR
ncbi:MAG: peptidylprolyl isomerase [Planctomycetales bacterium]|nr:peptidylprolyl isomerase [Planctomycetales bacterium]